jgi:hypothetical protein
VTALSRLTNQQLAARAKAIREQAKSTNGSGAADTPEDRMPDQANDRIPWDENDSKAASPKIQKFPVMAPEAYIGLAGDLVRAIAPTTEADPTGLLLSAHAFFGNCVGRGPHYRVEATTHSPNLYVVKVGNTSKARKGTGEDRIRSIFRHVDQEWTEHRIHTGLSSGEGLIWEVRNPITKMVKDKKTGFTVEETIDPGQPDKRLLVIESEFAGTLRVMQRDGNILSRVLRDGWDGGFDLAVLTKNSPARATGACISVIGHITATELLANFDRTEMANGFGNRFLFDCVRRAGLLPHGATMANETVSTLAYSVRQAAMTARGIGEVTMTPDAAELWGAVYEDLSSDRPGLLGALTARSEAQAVRLALLYALWAGSDRIELDHLMAALAVEGFCRNSVEYIFGDALGDPVSDTILGALRTAGSSGLTRTEMSNLFARHVQANQISRALGDLARKGMATQRRSEASAGRPAEIWIATGAAA